MWDISWYLMSNQGSQSPWHSRGEYLTAASVSEMEDGTRAHFSPCGRREVASPLVVSMFMKWSKAPRCLEGLREKHRQRLRPCPPHTVLSVSLCGRRVLSAHPAPARVLSSLRSVLVHLHAAPSYRELGFSIEAQGGTCVQ